ncbi:MAG: amidohydrolase family protein [Acidobacteria bacterium]|nr:amidohydrolase family protein [Acidobacteriota bacterium]
MARHVNTRRQFLASIGATVPSAAAAGVGIVDTHTHFYDPSRPQGVPWPPRTEPSLYRKVLPDEYIRMVRPLGVTGTIVVEASAWLEDNQWLLDLAASTPFIVGVAGRLEAGEPGFDANLERFRRDRLFLGIRLAGAVLAERLARPEFLGDVKLLSEAGLALDVLGDAASFSHILRLTDRVPRLRVVINHLPVDGSEPMLGEFRHRPLIFAKVSGVLRRVNGRVPANTAYYRESLDRLWDAFGEDRLIYGSNWPVSDRMAPYATVLDVVREYFQSKGAAAGSRFFHENSKAAYRWAPR